MTRMLVSVTSPKEAAMALAGGADIIDLKPPAPGAAAPEAIGAMVRAIGGRRPASAMVGDAVAAAVRDLAACGVEYVKLGLFPGDDAVSGIRGLAGVAAEVKLLAVLFADASPDLSLLTLLAQSGFAGAMLDTLAPEGGEKGSGRLLDHLTVSAVHGFVADCHAAGLIAGLAGALEPPDVPRLLVLAPDLLGFRHALCDPGGQPPGSIPAGCRRCAD